MNENAYPYIITVSSEKGGVGKTTLATNLAIFLKALDEDLPVSIFSLDNHYTIDKMFSIKGQNPKGSVADFLMEAKGADLLHTGQYGVSYIPSSDDLADLRASIKSPMLISKLTARSGISGVLIIDTRPDLDILTQNALYAADRVIIPVKDMASMDNCKNIFALFDKRGMDKSSLYLVPCLVDERIKYDGPFKDQKSLIKAFTINRGYRSFETIISKSPKVESLNTNPDGKVYPILSHAKGTEVHGQFFRLSTEIIKDIRKTSERRSKLFDEWLNSEDSRKKDAFEARLSGVRSHCLGCGKPADIFQENGAISYYCETGDSRTRGFMDEECLMEILRENVYGLPGHISRNDLSWQLISDAARTSTFIFKSRKGNNSSVDFHRFDSSGRKLASRTITVYPDRVTALHRMIEHLATPDGSDSFISIHPVNPAEPARILKEEGYRQFSRLKQIIAEQLTT